MDDWVIDLIYDFIRDHRYSATDEQLLALIPSLVKDLRDGFSMEREYSGEYNIPNPLQTEIKDLKDRLANKKETSAQPASSTKSIEQEVSRIQRERNESFR